MPMPCALHGFRMPSNVTANVKEKPGFLIKAYSALPVEDAQNDDDRFSQCAAGALDGLAAGANL